MTDRRTDPGAPPRRVRPAYRGGAQAPPEPPDAPRWLWWSLAAATSLLAFVVLAGRHCSDGPIPPHERPEVTP